MTHAMTLRLDDDMYEWLRQEAFDRRVPISALIRGHLAGVRAIARSALPAPTADETVPHDLPESMLSAVLTEGGGLPSACEHRDTIGDGKTSRCTRCGVVTEDGAS